MAEFKENYDKGDTLTYLAVHNALPIGLICIQIIGSFFYVKNMMESFKLQQSYHDVEIQELRADVHDIQYGKVKGVSISITPTSFMKRPTMTPTPTKRPLPRPSVTNTKE